VAEAYEVLAMLRPEGGYVHYGLDFEGIQFLECEPITKKEFEEGFAKYDAWKAKQDADKATQKASVLNRLGITQDEARLLLS
jgi:hypothetical protein